MNDIQEISRIQDKSLPQKLIIETKSQALPTIESKKLKSLVRQMSGAFRNSEGGSIIERFEEISKLLFIKMFDEQEVQNGNKNNLEFLIGPKDNIESVFIRINVI